MITEADFRQVNDEVVDAINQVLDTIRAASTGNYVLFLADGEYVAKYENTSPPSEPRVIDSRVDGYDDESRVKFLVQFLQSFYTFPKSAGGVVDDSEIRQQMELMIYTHVWESKPFLKKLFRLASLIIGNGYQWDVTVPPMGKHDFIRNEIRQKLEDNGMHLFQVIKNGFHTSVRNAFAHSEYSFDDKNKLIWLRNYGGASWELENISFDDWSKRFIYTILLAYRLMEIGDQRRRNLINDFGTDIFEIDYPIKAGGVVKIKIKYRVEHNAFGFVH